MNFDSAIILRIANFLPENDLINLSYTNLNFNSEIKQLCKERIFNFQVSKLPIIQSHIHWMANASSKPMRYHWNKTNFTPEEKAKINIHLLDNLSEYQFAKYDIQAVIFTLHDNGLMCQLPSHSHIIREYEKTSGKNEYTFLRNFYINSIWNDEDSDSVFEYSKISVSVYDNCFPIDNFPQIKEVVQIMEEFYLNREGKLLKKKYEFSDYTYYNIHTYLDLTPTSDTNDS